MKAIILSRIAAVALMLAILFLLLNRGLFGHGPISIGIQVCAALLMIWARLAFGLRSFHYLADATAGGLITKGPYHYLRHPIYTSISLFTWTGIIANWSVKNCLFGLVAAAAILARIHCEEMLLPGRYPEYVAYCRRTKRLIPFIY